MAKSQAQAEATARYDSANLKKEMFDFHVEEDADIIKYIEEMKEYGYTYREIVRQLWEVAK